MSPTEDCNRLNLHSGAWRMLLTLLISFIFVCASEAQNVQHLFRNGAWIHYVGTGDLDGKRVVSDIRVTPKDSTNREIHLKLEILTDWKLSDTLEIDLVLDPAANPRVKTDGKEVEAIRYRVRDSEVFMDFEKPVSFTYYNQNRELITDWVSHYAWINFPQQLKKYREVLEIYHEK